MAIDPSAIGAVTEPMLFEWTDRDTMLYALGVGAGLDDLSFTTENSHDITQQVLPTYAVICCPAFGAAGKIGKFNLAMLLHGSQEHPAARAAAGSGQAVGGHRGRRPAGQGRGQERDRHAARPRHRPGLGAADRRDADHARLRRRGRVRRARRVSAPSAPEFPDREPDTRGRPAHPRGSGADLPAVRRPQPAAQRPVVRPGAGRFPQADPARAVHLRGRRAARWSPSSARVLRPTSPRSLRASPRRCSRARR